MVKPKLKQLQWPGAVLARKLPGANSRYPWELPQHTVTWWSSSSTAQTDHAAGQCHPFALAVKHHCSSNLLPYFQKQWYAQFSIWGWPQDKCQWILLLTFRQNIWVPNDSRLHLTLTENGEGDRQLSPGPPGGQMPAPHCATRRWIPSKLMPAQERHTRTATHSTHPTALRSDSAYFQI